MYFQQIPVNSESTRNFSYIAGCEESNEAILIDPAFQPDLFLKRLEEADLKLQLILNTHGHHDHVNANREVQEETGAEILNHPADSGHRDAPVEEGEVIKVGTVGIQVFHTPGHSPGSCCFLLNQKILLSGDTLFVGKVGGTSHHGEDAREQYESLHNKLMRLSDDIEVYPGHDYGPHPHSTIGWERKHNPFVLQPSFIEFCQLKDEWPEKKKEWEERWEEQSG